MASEPAAPDWYSLERVIRAYPTHWFNVFDAWSPPDGRA